MAAKKEFTAESKSGIILRLIQVYNVIDILIAMTCFVFIKGSTVYFDMTLIAMVMEVLAQAVVIWLIARRKMYTRQIVIAIEIIEGINVIVGNVAANASPTVILLACIPDILVALYFAFSRRAKAVLVQPFSDMTLADQAAAKNRKMWDPKSKDFWLRLLIYFFVFSIMGHWMEMGVQILVINGIMPGTVAGPTSLTWRDSLNPFFIYGIAFSLCGLALFPIYDLFRQHLPKRWQAFLASYGVNLLFCVVAELILGFAFNADHHAWNYSNQFMNFEGQICLLYSLLFGILASVMTWFVYPLLERVFSHANRDVFRGVFVASLVLFLLIYCTYNVELDDLMPGQGLSVDYDEVTS